MRSFILATSLFAVIAVLEITRPSFADRAPIKVTQRELDFAWMDGLGYPAVKTLKFVRVATGRADTNDFGQLENTYVHGLLLDDRGNKFDVLILDLTKMKTTFIRTPLNAPPHERVDYEPAELGIFASLALNQLQLEAQGATDDDGARQQMMRRMTAAMSGDHVSGRVMTFSLAWVCFHHGLDDLSERLYDQAGSKSHDLPEWLYNQASSKSHDRGSEDKRTLREKLAAELAAAEMSAAEWAFGSPDVTRPELKEKFARVVKHFPKTERHQSAAGTVALLEQMIREDVAHAAVRAKGKPFYQLDKNEQARELVFLLRDQTGFSGHKWGGCDIFRNFARNESTPAHQLVKQGYDAVPALIEALGDRRFTRAVSYGRHYDSCQTLTIGQCAQQILERISGLSLDRPTYSKEIQKKDMSQVEKAKAEARAWYAELKTKGEKQWLIDAVKSGANTNLATRLRERYPKDALPALIAGAKAASNEWHRHCLVLEIGSVDGEAPLRFLLAELKEGPLFQGRYAAALCLRDRNRPEALAAMIAEWSNQKFVPEKSDGSSNHLASLAGFLAESGKPEAIAALAKDLVQRPIDVRVGVYEAMLCDPIREAFKSDNAKDQEKRKLRAAVEELLVAALDDTEKRLGMCGSRNGKRFSSPRGCDMAGFMLNELAPARYYFDLEAPWALRRYDILELKNAWRKAHKLPALTIPEPKPIARVPEKTLEPLLGSFLAGNADQRRQAQADIEKLGLGALSAVRNRRDAASKKEDEKRLDDLLKRIACIVAEIEFAEKSLKPDAALSKRLEELKGKPFDSKRFLKVIGATLKAPPPCMRGLHVTAERVGDGTGFTLRFDLLDLARAGGKANVKGPPPWVVQTQDISVGNEGVRCLSGGSQFSAWTESNDSELADVLDGVLASAPERSIDINLALTLKWDD